MKLRLAPKKKVEKPQVLVFDLGISTNQGRVSTPLGKSEKIRKFVRGSEKVSEIQDFLEKVR